MDLAKTFLQNWDFLSNVDKANENITEVKNILKKEYRIKFQGNDEEDGDDLDEYIQGVKDKANLFL